MWLLLDRIWTNPNCFVTFVTRLTRPCTEVALVRQKILIISLMELQMVPDGTVLQVSPSK